MHFSQWKIPFSPFGFWRVNKRYFSLPHLSHLIIPILQKFSHLDGWLFVFQFPYLVIKHLNHALALLRVYVSRLEQLLQLELVGLQLGDVIMSIDGALASDGRRSMNQVARTQPGEQVVVEVLRAGELLELTTEIGLRPPAEVQEQ